MSDNVCGYGDLHINVGIQLEGRELIYHITTLRDGENAVVLKGHEAVLASIAILRDALPRETILKNISKPSREMFAELRAVIDKIEGWAFNEGEKK